MMIVEACLCVCRHSHEECKHFCVRANGRRSNSQALSDNLRDIAIAAFRAEEGLYPIHTTKPAFRIFLLLFFFIKKGREHQC